MFRIPSGLSNLTAQYRYNTGDSWQSLSTRTSSDFFSGINAARFDYANNVAYLSIAFSPNSNSIFVQILDGSSAVSLTYLGIPLYYDDRHAAVTVTLDDWEADFETGAHIASSYLTTAHIHYSVGIVSQNYSGLGPDWALIQNWYDQGYLEPAGHSRTHPCSDVDYQTNGYDWEVSGIRDDILANLTLAYPYVPAFIEPCGFESSLVRQAVASAHYLADRGWQAPPVQGTFASWGGDGTYQRVMYSYDTWSWTQAMSPTLLAQANSSFDAAYAAGEIYHLVDHPWQNLFFDGSDLVQHFNYISNRPDVWYAAFGQLYLYHYVQERGQVTVSPVGVTAVILSSFDARALHKAILIQWKTASELDNFGFNLYRAEGLKANRTRLNETLIPAKSPDGLVGADYEFRDITAAQAKTYYYWLETVGAEGTELYDPATVTPGSPRAPYLPLLYK